MISRVIRLPLLLRYVDREAAMWIVALTILAIGNPESDFHFTIFLALLRLGNQEPRIRA